MKGQTRAAGQLLVLLVALLLMVEPVMVSAGPSAQQGSDPQPVDDQAAPAPNPNAVSDDFNACALNTTLWEFLDPVGNSTQAIVGGYTGNATLNITVPAGSRHQIWTTGNNSARVMQSLNNPNNFEIVARYMSGVAAKFQMQGILIEQDASRFMRVEVYGNGVSTMIFWALFDGTNVHIFNDRRIGDPGMTVFLKVWRNKKRHIVSWSKDGTTWDALQEPDWTTLPGLAANKVGVYAGNDGTDPPAHTAVIDYFFNTASPINPEDGGIADLIVTPVGSGSVTVTPVKPNYSCFESVTLDAVPVANWHLANWSGSLTGTDDPATLIMTGPARVTATFEVNQYPLNIAVVPPTAGSVTRVPDQPLYVHGTSVSLQPSPAANWRFVNWTGAAAGALVDNHDGSWTIAMTEVRDLIANFEVSNHSLTIGVTPAGRGVVQKDPDLASYPHNSDVVLSPTPNPGWSFYGWSGPDLADLADNGDGSWTLNMDADKSVTANFIQDVYYITKTVVGRGTVQISPAAEGPYLYGEVATLRPLPATSWKFSGWSGPDFGDLVDKQNGTWTLTMDGNKAVTATFVSYPVYVPLVYR